MNHNNPWGKVHRELKGEIMKTDIYCEIQCHADDKLLAEKYLDRAFVFFRDFEKRYSRFLTGNELWQLNESERISVSPELFSLLELCVYWHKKTEGIFDPSILLDLESEGYPGAYGQTHDEKRSTFRELFLDEKTGIIEKPKELKIDLGGIGKGFIVDKVTSLFRERFSDFLVDAGGDIMAAGTNRVSGYQYWAIGMEDPLNQANSAATLMLRDMAVATSGTNRRTWTREGIRKHHLIDPKSRKSKQTDVQSVTVLAKNTVEADIWAKTLFLLGEKKGLMMAEGNVPAIFIMNDGRILINEVCQTYVWKQVS